MERKISNYAQKLRRRIADCRNGRSVTTDKKAERLWRNTYAF